jgi:hypothetical protein
MSLDDTNELQIIGAAYGLGRVTSKVISLVNRSTTPQSLSVAASNSVFGDTWPGFAKSLTIVYRYGTSGSPVVASGQEGSTITIGPAQHAAAVAARHDAPATPLPLTIWGATYATENVTSAVQSMISPADQSLSLTPSNQTFGGDPWPGVRKTFVIVASYPNQVPFLDIVQEGTPYFLKFRPPLQILSGFFGLLDVLLVLQSKVSRRALNVQASDSVFGDGWPGVAKTLDVVYQYGDRTPQLATVKEGENLSIDYDSIVARYAPPVDPAVLNVVAAAFGPADVTAKVRSLISDQQLNFTANDSTFSDPWPGFRKSFAMTYSWGPSAVTNLLVQENSPVVVSQPTVEWTQGFTSLAGLLANGDLLTLQTGVGFYWAVTPGGQIVANAATIAAAQQFTIGGVNPGQPGLTLQASDQSYVMVGADGTLHTGGTVQQAAVLVPSLLNSGSIALCVSGSPGAPFVAVDANGAIVAGSEYSPDFSSSFNLRLTATAVGLENHIRAYTGQSRAELESAADVDTALLQVIWDLTGGWFLALGLGPLMSGSTAPRAGILNLIRSNGRANAALNNLIAAVRSNPEASLTAAFIAFEGVIWDERLMWPIFRFVANQLKWWMIAYVATTLLVKLAVLPELEAAELTVSFAIWGYNTATDIIAYVNSGAT